MPKVRRELVTHTFCGGRFEDNGVDLDVLPDLLAYKSLLIETAKELWRRKNPERQRLPRNFEESLVLKFYEVRAGSAGIPLCREIEGPEQAALWPPQPDELDEAVGLIADAVQAAASETVLPEALPRSVMWRFEEYGRTLRKDECFEQHLPGRACPAKYTITVRDRMVQWAEQAYEDTVDIIGAVTMARVSRPRMAIMMDDGREVEAVFSPEDEDVITTALKEHTTTKVRVQGRAEFLPSGQLHRLVRVDSVSLLPADEVPFHPTAKPIWEAIAEIMSTVPDEELRKLPRDGAEQHDHYIYGTPKRRS